MKAARTFTSPWLAGLLLSLTPASFTPAAHALTPPKAERIAHPTIIHGDTLKDDYYWLREKTNPKVIDYLNAENTYADTLTSTHRGLTDALYKEILSRIKQTDLSVPYLKDGYLYYSRTEEGKQYPIFCRRKGSMEAPEEVTIDVNELARGHRFMGIGDYEPSPDGKRLAYSIDSTGYRQYILQIKDLTTGKVLTDNAERVTSVAWAANNQTLFYSQEDPVAKRSHRLYRHMVGDARHELIYEEKDERYYVDVGLSRSHQWLIQTRSSNSSSEVAVLPAASPNGTWKLVSPRRQGREYYLDHRGDLFWIRTNDRGKNYRLVTAPMADPDSAKWKEIIPHRMDAMISAVSCFKDHIVIGEREGGLPGLAVLDPVTFVKRRVPFQEKAYTVGGSSNAEFDTPTFRYTYQSFLAPSSVYDLDLKSFESKLLKRTEVLGGWDPSRYAMERLWATASDGVKVPITILFRKDLRRDGTAPCLLYGYGSYGSPSNVTFSSNRFSLVDRGVVYAVAHIRGGGDMGETWHEAGRMSTKMNTFTDFIACAEQLVTDRIARRDGVVIQGGSAGGLLMGAVTNLRPDLFRGVVSQVPFVDVINTQLDESLPLVVTEFEEWGNPKIPEQYRWMVAYSPYDNIRATAYPNMLVRTSLNDSQVMYWEPAKYVARLRATRTDKNPLVFKCNMGAGHGGASGRYDALRDLAFDYAWILTTVGLEGVAARP